MKKILFSAVLAVILFSSCDYRTVKGNGNIVKQQRSASSARKIKLRGSYNVELSQTTGTSLSIEADENLMQHILVSNEDGWLVIQTEEHIRLKPSNRITVTVGTDLLEAISLSGSGNIHGNNKFSGGDKLDLNISGSGNAQLEVNAANISTKISGSGDIQLAGEAKDLQVNISGSGKYKGYDMKTEAATINISGSGDANVYAENSLNVNVSGVGKVKYKGNATVSQRISGSGSVQKEN
jgi:hypothetical protein